MTPATPTTPASPSIVERARRVRLVLLDVDGVLTDGRLLYGAGGDEGRAFHVRDGLGISLARRAGLRVGIVSGRRVEAVQRRCEELALDEIHQGHHVKGPVWDEIVTRRGLGDDEVAFMGDDVLDLPLLRRAGFAAVPSDAVAAARAAAHWVASVPGGAGCVRELLELVVEARGSWDGEVARLLATPGD
jgi:3-deoxy-D-manno-octulosonate 8-phosphate phosphatase (KDO 8-P phosphatase)